MALSSTERKSVQVLSPVMAKNNEIAAENRRALEALGVFAVNIIGSPGCGKTTLLEAMAGRFGRTMAVIEGDVQTRRDAERVERAGCIAHQIETQGACHLDARAISKALDQLDIEAETCRILVIENVGNLICPSGYALGEHLKIGVLSTPEGDDKILKYPSLFSRIDVLVINKVDLLPHLDFDVERVKEETRSLKPDARAFELSARTGAGVDAFCEFLRNAREERFRQ